jgi:type IV pilus assembly protein PilC
MGILLRHNIPLPEALRMTADGVGSNHVRNLSVTLANGVATGRSLSQLLASGRGMPRSLAPLVRWGEQTNTLADALTTGSDMYQNRVRRRSLLLQSILPPGMFIALGGCILFVVVSLFIPLVSLVQGLSS